MIVGYHITTESVQIEVLLIVNGKSVWLGIRLLCSKKLYIPKKVAKKIIYTLEATYRT